METARWHLGTKIAFRFAFIYFVLYTIYVPLHLVLIPPVPQIANAYSSLWNAIVLWVSNHVLHLHYDFSLGKLNTAAGSKDTMHAYIRGALLPGDCGGRNYRLVVAGSQPAKLPAVA